MGIARLPRYIIDELLVEDVFDIVLWSIRFLHGFTIYDTLLAYLIDLH
jgi:hypothetical protein